VRQRYTVLDGCVRVSPAALPEGEIGEVGIVDADHVILAQCGSRGLEVRSRGVELATAGLHVGADGKQPVREARGDAAQRGGAEPVGLVPVPHREQRLDLVRHQHGVVDLSPAHHLEPRPAHTHRFPEPSQHRQRVGEIAVRAGQAEKIADLLGELQGLTKVGDTLLAAAEVGEVGAEHGDRSHLCLACADTPG
jgi:hypothetical protein